MMIPAIEDFERDFSSESWAGIAKAILDENEIPFSRLERAAQGESVIYLADEKYVVKIFNPNRNPGALDREKLALENARTNLPIPGIVAFGEFVKYKYLIMTQLRGTALTRESWLKLNAAEQITILRQLAEGLRALHRSDASKMDFAWNEFIASQAKNCYERQKNCRVNGKLLAQIPAYLEENLHLLPIVREPVFLHGDVHFGNLRIAESGGKWRISGLFDFADSLRGFHEYDFLAVTVLMIQGQGARQREFFRAYGYADREIDDALRKRLMLLTMFYETSDLRRYAARLRPEAVDYSLVELERAIWNF